MRAFSVQCGLLIAAIALASGPALAADPLAELPVFTPASTDTLAFDTRDGMSMIGGLSVRGPILELCDAGKLHCAAGYPGMAISLPVDGKLNFTLADHMAGAAPAMSHCMDESDWTDTDGWRSKAGLFNLHTHGLLVKPYARRMADPAQNLYGDYIFDCVTGAAGYAPPAGGHVIGANMTFSDNFAERVSPSSPRVGQPYGINWFHPHIHGIAKAQVSLGMAGMILAGDPLSELCLSVNPANQTCNQQESQQLKAKTRVRNILLKDAQLIHVGGPGGSWLNNADQDPAFCQGNERAGDNIGQCVPVNASGMATPAGTAIDQPGDNDLGPRWVFTLNGQRYPDIAFDADHPYQLLRLQNASANITYKLSLRRSFDDGTVAAPYGFSPKFSILSMDGAGYIAKGNGETPVKSAREVLLMPASRAELLIDAAQLCPKPCTGGATYQLVTDAFQAGYAPADADTWPQVALARVSVPSAAEPVVAMISPPPQLRQMTTMQAMAPRTVPTPEIASRCRLAGGDAGHYAIHLAPGDKRRLYFGIFKGTNPLTNEDVEDFVLGTSVLHPDGSEADLTGRPIDPATNPVRLHVMSMTDEKVDLCVEAGHRETWQLVNISDEVHNFHIHQVKFTVARDASDRPVWRVPSPLDEQVLPEELIFSGGQAELQHDTIVVPRGRSSCAGSLTAIAALPEEGPRAYTLSGAQFLAPDAPRNETGAFIPARCDGSGSVYAAHDPKKPYLDVSGMIEVAIPFVGTQLDATNGEPATFVYHCHILEHEDKGMMASIAVLHPR